jgi:hypothetical protein
MPTAAVTRTVEPAAGDVPPRMRLDVVDTDTPALYAMTVVRVNPDGTATPVRTSNGEPRLVLSTSGNDRVGVLYDYEVPFGHPARYSTMESSSVVSGEAM